MQPPEGVKETNADSQTQQTDANESLGDNQSTTEASETGE